MDLAPRQRRPVRRLHHETRARIGLARFGGGSLDTVEIDLGHSKADNGERERQAKSARDENLILDNQDETNRPRVDNKLASAAGVQFTAQSVGTSAMTVLVVAASNAFAVLNAFGDAASQRPTPRAPRTAPTTAKTSRRKGQLNLACLLRAFFDELDRLEHMVVGKFLGH